jgi:hypothetical protein
MTVRGTDELRNWILSLGPWVEVIEPGALRKQVATLLREATDVYRDSQIA